jgi:hypothetical protein
LGRRRNYFKYFLFLKDGLKKVKKFEVLIYMKLFKIKKLIKYGINVNIYKLNDKKLIEKWKNIILQKFK